MKEKKDILDKPTKREITIKAPPLYRWQNVVAKAVNRFNTNSFISVLSPRQRGKSFTLKIIALMRSINRKNMRVFIVTPTFGQSDALFKEISKTVKSIPGLHKASNASTRIIEMVNGSTINLKSVEQGDNLRGYTADLVIIDEAAYCNKDVVQSCVLPWTNTTGGSIVLFSTPRFRNEKDLFYYYYSKGVGKESKGFISIDWTKYDTSALLPEEKFEQYKATLPNRIFVNEILGQFIDADGGVFGDFTPVINQNPRLTGNYTAGVDFGATVGKDYTAISIFNEHNEQVHIEYRNDLKPVETVKWLVEVIRKWKPSSIGVEVNSIGQVYFDMLKREVRGVRLIPFTTTNQSKRKIIEELAKMIEACEISLLDDRELQNELTAYEVNELKSGLTYNAPSGYHDDLVMATAIALHTMKTGKYNIR